MAQIWTRFRALILGFLGVASVVATWDVYKAIGPEQGVLLGDTRILPRTTDLAMPHSWEMLQRFTEPVTRSPERPTPSARCTTPACSRSAWLPAAG